MKLAFGRSPISIFGLLAVTFLSAGCWRASDSSDQALKVHLSSEPVSLDPALAEDGMSLRILANTMEGLFGYDSEGVLKNRLVESYEISRDQKRYEFRILKGARWSDGAPITVEQFVAGFQRSLGPNSVSKLAPLLAMVRKVSQSNGALVLELERPAPHLLHVLTLPIAFPIRPDILDENSGKWPITAPCTGPYFVSSHAPDRRITLLRNPHYHAAPLGPAQVELVVVGDESTAANLFEQGQIDILTKLPPSDFPRLRKTGRVRTDPYLATYFLSFNTRKPPFNNLFLRRAVAAAIDREQIVALLDSGEMAAAGWIPPGLEGATTFKSVAPRAAASAKLDKLGPVSAGFDGNARNFLIMQKIQQDLLKKLGLRLELQNTDWKSHIRSLQTDPPALYRFGWQAPFRDPISHLRAFTSKDPNNYSGWKNAEYDGLVDRIEALAPGTTREALIRRAQKLLVEKEAAVIPIYHYVQNHAVSKRVAGFRANPFGMIFFRELTFTPDE